MRSPRFLGLLLPAALVVAGCGEQTAPPETINESVDGISEIQDLPAYHRGDRNPIVALSLAWTVITEVPEIPGVYQPFSGVRKLSWVAYQRRDDGTDAMGWSRYYADGEQAGVPRTQSSRGRVVCLNYIEDADTWLMADETIERSGDLPMAALGLPAPTPDDDGTVFAFRDNGSGHNADPDQLTLRIATLKAVAKGICENPPPSLVALSSQILLPVERGFIKVID